MSTQVRLGNESPCPWPPTRWHTAWTWTSPWSLGTWRREAGSLSAQMTTGKSIGLPLRHAGQQDTWYSPGGKICDKYICCHCCHSGIFFLSTPATEWTTSKSSTTSPTTMSSRARTPWWKTSKGTKGSQNSRWERIEINPKYQKGTEGTWSGRGTPWPRRVGKVLCKKVVKESKNVYGSPTCNRV